MNEKICFWNLLSSWLALGCSGFLTVTMGGEMLTSASAGKSLEQNDSDFLHDLTRDVVDASHVEPGQKVGGSPTNTCGFTLIMPGGRGSYPAFWIRDYSMSLESGFITAEEMWNHLGLTASCQNGPTPRQLKNGLLIPPYAIPDHINFDGRPVFYPGTYSSGDDQGTGNYGIIPPIDDHYEFVHMAWVLFQKTGKTDFLNTSINGMSLLERITTAFNCPKIDTESGLVITDDARRAVGFGFCDAIYLTGHLLFPSLLRYRAAGQLADLSQALGNQEKSKHYRQIQNQIADNVAIHFSEPDRIQGWLMGATKTGRQPDVWGSSYALCLGAIKGEAAIRAADTLIKAVRSNTIVFEGAVRHVPTDHNASAKSAWERTAGVAVNTYQNGAYWHTPTGWLIKAIRSRDPKLASKLQADYLLHLRKHDFRLGKSHGPWECFGPSGYTQNGVYMTSVTLPFISLR